MEYRCLNHACPTTEHLGCILIMHGTNAQKLVMKCLFQEESHVLFWRMTDAEVKEWHRVKWKTARRRRFRKGFEWVVDLSEAGMLADRLLATIDMLRKENAELRMRKKRAIKKRC